MTEKDIARFWSKVNKDGPIPKHRPELGKCWMWTGYISKKTKIRSAGYGRFRLQGKYEVASRAAYLICKGSIPFGKMVCHHCDTPGCVKIDHLFIGDDLANATDRKQKGRYAVGDNNPSRVHPEKLARGTQNPRAVLTEAVAKEIKSRQSSGETAASVARALGLKCNAKTVYDVFSGRTWRHITLD